MTEVNANFQNEAYWSGAWMRHIDNYLATAPRAGYWLAQHYRKEHSLLEIAGGSCRDSKFLADNGFQATGTDFDQDTLDYLRERHGFSHVTQADAFNLPFEDNAFQMSFSNGFWVLFDDNNSIAQLIKEQARVTEKYLISFVHNQANPRLVDKFKQQATTDDLYNIRFFDREAIPQLVKDSGVRYKSIRLLKFGAYYPDRLLSLSFGKRYPWIDRLLTGIVPRLYPLMPWNSVERIAVIVELDK